MSKDKNIILLEDDPKVSSQIGEILSDYTLTFCETNKDFFEKITKDNYDLVLIDFDLKEKDGLLVFKELRLQCPSCKTIMFSSSNSIPLAVQATKLGVLDFLRKPFESALLVKSVENFIREEKKLKLNLEGIKDIEWLKGISLVVQKARKDLLNIASKDNNIILYGEKGINKRSIAEVLHINGINSSRRFVPLDISSFNSDALEPHFFITLKELISSSTLDDVLNTKNIVGTVFISGIDFISEQFRMSVMQFIKDKKSPTRIILETYNQALSAEFEVFALPPIRLRREDIPCLFLLYLKQYAPQIKYVDPQIFEFIMNYDFPGNYDELRFFLQASTLPFCGTEVLNFKNILIDLNSFCDFQKNRMLSCQNYDLLNVRNEFEKNLIKIVMEKLNGETHAAARFLDIPHTSFVERLSTLKLL